MVSPRTLPAKHLSESLIRLNKKLEEFGIGDEELNNV